MTEYQRRRRVNAPAGTLFTFLSRPEDLPSYIPGMTSAARRDTGGDIDVTAEVMGQDVRAVAHLEIDQDERRLVWSSPGESHYHGELQVSDDGAASVVEVAISTDRVADPGRIGAGLDETLDRIQQLVEAGVATGSVAGG